MTRTWRPAARLLTIALGLLADAAATRAADGPGDRPGWTPLAQALKATAETGRPTVVVVTGATDAGSELMRRSLPAILQTQPVGQSVSLAEMPAEVYGERLRQMQVNTAPSILVYARGEGGLKLASHRLGITDPYQAVGWLATLRLDAPPPSVAAAPTDAALQRTQYPSGQGATPQAPPPPPPAYYAPPPAVPVAPVQPVYSAPAPAMVMAPAPQPVVVAQAPQPIIFAPAPAPAVYTAAAPAPLMTAPAPAQLFAAPAPAPPPVAYAPVAAAPPMAYAPVAMAPPQQVAQSPAAAAVATMILTNPSLIEKVLGAIGRHFAEKGNPRISMAPAPALAAAPVAYAPAPQAYAPAPAAYAPAEAPSYAPAYAPTPSPQGGFLRHFHK